MVSSDREWTVRVGLGGLLRSCLGSRKPGGASEIHYYLLHYRLARPYFNERNQLVSENEFLLADYDYLDSSDATAQHDPDLESNHHNEFITINTTSTRFRITNKLKPYTYYEFKIQAGNYLGLSELAPVIRARTAASSKNWGHLD